MELNNFIREKIDKSKEIKQKLIKSIMDAPKRNNQLIQQIKYPTELVLESDDFFEQINNKYAFNSYSLLSISINEINENGSIVGNCRYSQTNNVDNRSETSFDRIVFELAELSTPALEILDYQVKELHNLNKDFTKVVERISQHGEVMFKTPLVMAKENLKDSYLLDDMMDASYIKDQCKEYSMENVKIPKEGIVIFGSNNNGLITFIDEDENKTKHALGFNQFNIKLLEKVNSDIEKKVLLSSNKNDKPTIKVKRS
jgi:hypothetical protein